MAKNGPLAKNEFYIFFYIFKWKKIKTIIFYDP